MTVTRSGALSHRNFTLFLVGQIVSYAGNGIFMVALPLEVLRLTNDPVSLGLVVGGDSLMAVVLMLFGGALVDRLPKRQILIVANLISAVAVAIAAMLVSSDRVTVWQLAVLTLVFGAANAIILPASTAIVADLLPPRLLVSGNSMRELAFSLGQALSGPLLGGLIVATIGYAWAFGINGMTFVAALLCLGAMSRDYATAAHDPAPERGDTTHDDVVDRTVFAAGTEEPGEVAVLDHAGEAGGMLVEIAAGLKYTKGNPWLWWNIIGMSFANFAAFLPLLVTEPLLVRNVFHASGAALGVVLGASGLGGVMGSLIVRFRGAPVARVPAMWAGFAVAGIGVVALGLSSGVVTAAIAAFFVWGGISYGNIVWFATMQENVPPNLLGRVSALDWALSLVASPLGIVAGAAVASGVGVRPTLGLGGVLVLASAAVMLIPGVRTVPAGAADTTETSAAGVETTRSRDDATLVR